MVLCESKSNLHQQNPSGGISSASFGHFVIKCSKKTLYMVRVLHCGMGYLLVSKKIIHNLCKDWIEKSVPQDHFIITRQATWCQSVILATDFSITPSHTHDGFLYPGWRSSLRWNNLAFIIEPQNAISNNVVCATSKGLDQSALWPEPLQVAWIFYDCWTTIK